MNISASKHKRSQFDFLGDLKLSGDVEEKLSLSLGRTVAGSDNVVLTPLGRSLDPVSILEGWDKIFNSPTGYLNSELLQLEESNRSKYGPRSIAKPWSERLEGVSQSFDLEPGIDYSQLALDSKRTPHLRPLTVNAAAKFVKNSTNSGLPYFTRKGDALDITIANHKSLLVRDYPCCLFTRTQEGGKTRTVWGYPLADTLEELCYYRPLLGYQKKLCWRSALLGPEAVDKSMLEMIVNGRGNGRAFLSIDFSSYDNSIKRNLQKYSFDYIKSLFQASESNRLDRIARRFNEIGLVTPDGVWAGPHGVPSGSTFTNEIDSIAQYLIAKPVIKDDRLLSIQGDDGAYCCSIAQNEILCERFRSFGLDVNREKSYFSPNYIVYLQKLYSYDYIRRGVGGGIYPTYRALSRLVYQERFTNFVDSEIDGKDFYSIRAITILENCKHHPLFVELVKYVLSLDKYRLQYSANGLSKYAKRLKESSGAEGILVNQYGDNIGGINQFETVKIIKELL